jgi:serine carboxypeptidase-like clade 1
LPVSAPTEAKVFYGFTESERGAHSDPLVLWLQGGPGCSPAGVAAFRLNGPFLLRFKGLPLSDLRLRRNPHSWTQLASLLYLDTPVWTGFTHAADNASARHWGAAAARPAPPAHHSTHPPCS